jgi:ATP-dependent Clp protease ATP-binding subunit ClpA/ATP-dependent Clp protease ATP-binding subunit ClpC
VRLDFTVGVYQARRDGEEDWIALTPIAHNARVSGQGEVKLRERLLERLRDVLRRATPAEQELFQMPIGTELVRVHVDVKLEHGKLSGKVPFIVEPRWTSETTQTLVVYHPVFREHWFVVDTRDDIEALAPTFLRHHFSDLAEEDFDEMTTDGKDRLQAIAFSAEARTLLDQLPSRKKDARAAASAPRQDNVLPAIAIDETRHASAGALRLGVARSPYRERMTYLLGGARPRSVAVVGPPGAGKTMVIRQWIADRLVEDGYPIHKNIDRVHHVWRLTGKRLIAGMSYLGQWEERCLTVLDEARKWKGILWIEDLHLFGRLGQSRQSERSFADFFRGPIRRGDLAIVAELTPAQHARLERDAPGLAEALALVNIPAASITETSQLLLHEIRALEVERKVALHPFVPRTALELGAALFPWRARPGVAIEIVRRVAEDAVRAGIAEGQVPAMPGRAALPKGGAEVNARELTPADVLDNLARTTGLSSKLLSLDEPLDAAEVEAAFAARVVGQPTATRAAADVILRVRAGLADPGRPVNVMLFTGPTGTGKTELATAIAEYLYGNSERLLRVDMGELSGPDAVARLIGDRWQPDGLLTSRVRAQPFCVVLLDEIEKAHPQALHLLLQLFDEGRLTDANGEVASFASAVVIMTSNLGSKNAAPIGFGDTRDRILADVAKAVREFFPVELFNRIDQVVPFEPLTPEVAAKVVDKELAKLLARRGLRERNTFVYAGAAVRRRAVGDAFDARYGARTVKRWLEDKIGGSLTDLLASAPPARLRIVRLAEHDGAIQATMEPLEERSATAGIYALEGALDLATAALEPALAKAVAALDRVRGSELLARAKDAATGELRYYVDELHQRLGALDDLLRNKPAPRHDELEDEPLYEEHIEENHGARGRIVRMRTRAAGRPTRPPASRDALLAGVAEALLLERALPDMLDPDAHAVTIVVTRIGSTADAHGLGIVTQALAQPAWLDDRPWVAAGDKLATVSPGQLDTSALYREVRDVAFVLRGLFVRSALANEHGTWMVRAAAAEPDVIRVDVRSGASHKPDHVLRAHLAARAGLERVLEHGGTMPPNPDVLLPVTRTLTYRPPLRPGETYGVELEDFGTGWVDRGTARDLPSAIRRAWHLAWSRLP